MKLLTTVAAASLVAGAAFAQDNTQTYDQPDQTMEQPDQTYDQPAADEGDWNDPALSEQKSAQDHVGKTAFSADGEEVGTVDEIVTAADGSERALISVGEFLGIGSKQIAIAPDELSASEDGSGVSLPLSAADIEAAPAYEGDSAEAEDESQDW